MNSYLTHEEVITKEETTGKVIRIHDGWLELAVGKNNALAEDYYRADYLLKKYVSEAQKRGCFRTGSGMDFHAQVDSTDYKVYPWSLGSTHNSMSRAFNWRGFEARGCFLRNK